MKLISLTLCFTLISLSSSVTLYAKGSPKKTLRTTKADFSGATINGQYAHSPDAQVSIEKEKKLISVVKPRTKLTIQIKKSQEDYK